MNAPEPTDEQAAQLALAYLRVVRLYAKGNTAEGLAALDDLIGMSEDDEATFARVFDLAALTLTIAASGFSELRDVPPNGQSWAGGAFGQGEDQDRAAVLQGTAAALAGDVDAALDVITARYSAGGFDALVDVLRSGLLLLVDLWRRGAFDAATGGDR
ncbi:hypothetical protein [Umezawaea beigongshangensis]|uniref:hypothetical protein n=1 Tax=Umezawaea beigongshangensis TaxID=2780383 RepID=UPI0018F18F59|nr:hypothetical protein [Umezawaea beigongshangensis]